MFHIECQSDDVHAHCSLGYLSKSDVLAVLMEENSMGVACVRESTDIVNILSLRIITIHTPVG